LILENLRRIAVSRETWIRVPLVPGFNDSEEEVRAILAFAKREPGLTRIDLHRYNPLGEEKHARLDRQCAHFTPPNMRRISRNSGRSPHQRSCKSPVYSQGYFVFVASRFIRDVWDRTGHSSKSPSINEDATGLF